MHCPECGTSVSGSFCPHCGTAVAQPERVNADGQSKRNLAFTVAASVLGLSAIATASWFLASTLMNGGNDSPPVTPVSASSTSTITPSTSTSSSIKPTESSSSKSSSSSSDNAAAELDRWATRDIRDITVSEDSWGVRLSTKWVGVTDPTNGHPDPYSADEIRSEFSQLKAVYGSKLKILKSDAVGLQNSAIKGRDGWIALVVDNDITSRESAVKWCKDHFESDLNKCGEQHLNAPH